MEKDIDMGKLDFTEVKEVADRLIGALSMAEYSHNGNSKLLEEYLYDSWNHAEHAMQLLSDMRIRAESIKHG